MWEKLKWLVGLTSRNEQEKREETVFDYVSNLAGKKRYVYFSDSNKKLCRMNIYMGVYSVIYPSSLSGNVRRDGKWQGKNTKIDDWMKFIGRMSLDDFKREYTHVDYETGAKNWEKVKEGLLAEEEKDFNDLDISGIWYSYDEINDNLSAIKAIRKLSYDNTMWVTIKRQNIKTLETNTETIPWLRFNDFVREQPFKADCPYTGEDL